MDPGRQGSLKHQVLWARAGGPAVTLYPHGEDSGVGVPLGLRPAPTLCLGLPLALPVGAQKVQGSQAGRSLGKSLLQTFSWTQLLPSVPGRSGGRRDFPGRGVGGSPRDRAGPGGAHSVSSSSPRHDPQGFPTLPSQARLFSTGWTPVNWKVPGSWVPSPSAGPAPHPARRPTSGPLLPLPTGGPGQRSGPFLWPWPGEGPPLGPAFPQAGLDSAAGGGLGAGTAQWLLPVPWGSPSLPGFPGLATSLLSHPLSGKLPGPG